MLLELVEYMRTHTLCFNIATGTITGAMHLIRIIALEEGD